MSDRMRRCSLGGILFAASVAVLPPPAHAANSSALVFGSAAAALTTLVVIDHQHKIRLRTAAAQPPAPISFDLAPQPRATTLFATPPLSVVTPPALRAPSAPQQLRLNEALTATTVRAMRPVPPTPPPAIRLPAPAAPRLARRREPVEERLPVLAPQPRPTATPVPARKALPSYGWGRI